MEIWKDIPGYEGIYQASTFGNIRTCEGKTTHTVHHGFRHWGQRILKQRRNKSQSGRIDPRVNLWKDGKQKTWLVSRLVGLTWCEGYKDGMTINHINGIPIDNRSENLEWVSISENIKKGFSEGLFGGIQTPVIISRDGVSTNFRSMAEASRFLGRNNGYVIGCIKNGTPLSDRNGNIYFIEKG